MQQEQDVKLYVVRRLRRAFLSICRCGDTLFSPYRLTTDQYALMRAVQRQQGIRQADLSNEIFAEPNTVTAMVSLLEKRGILRRKPSPTDGRARLLYLTAHGQTVMQRLSADWDPMRHILNECFSGEEGQQALEILDHVFEEMYRARKELCQRPYEKMTASGDVTTEAGLTTTSHGSVKEVRLAKKVSQRSREAKGRDTSRSLRTPKKFVNE